MQAEDRYLDKQIGNYRITSVLNNGAFGRVYKGVHVILTHRDVAIKLLHTNYLGSTEEQENFLQEAQFLDSLKHPHILPIYDVGIDDEGFPYLVAELAVNGSLRDYLRKYRNQRRLMPLEECLRIITQVGEALQFVHEQYIVHRDLKPENILFDANNDALIADFGIAVFLETTKTKYANATGSPLYMAPEQFEGLASRRSDQYALACITYELMTGQPPFNASHPLALGMKHQNDIPTPPSHLNSHIPVHIERAILKALAKKREDRYPDIAAFIHALATAPVGATHKTKEEWLEEGYQLFNAHSYQDALLAFERACALDPEFADAYEARGTTLYYLGRGEEALVSYERAIQLNPSYASAYSGRGNILFDAHNYAEACKAYEHATQLDPGLTEAYVGKGNALYYLAQFDEAVAAYDQAIHLDASSVPAYDGKGWVLWHAKQYQGAVTAFDHAIRLDQKNVSPLIGKGRSLYSLGHFHEAQDCFVHVLELVPDHVQAHEYLADTYYFLRLYEEALQEYQTTIELDPAIAAPLSGKGRVLYELGLYEEALLAFEQALALNPHLASAYNGKGKILSQLGSYEEALGAFEQAINFQPRVGAFHYNRAEALMQLGFSEEAEQEYGQARQLGYKI
ncbi:MAG TPA: tetratricopeptide repeat protein [Ktedonobacteraceae bacterium]|jgi:tetratricopeptide (TPR) repeat protein|nr:tetratricopeptide repeat protein [Ktedonobacteraceae bacterium]